MAPLLPTEKTQNVLAFFYLYMADQMYIDGNLSYDKYIYMYIISY
jgi:hypothetical protein